MSHEPIDNEEFQSTASEPEVSQANNSDPVSMVEVIAKGVEAALWKVLGDGAITMP
ncbi:hypothetical protein M404DRAFT_36446 [Pisolithus tinctorius Marx 270]|uniref:Uncharacterized protein n=1 Tax=Pisolithus tinctorius Marx 270 TaxID=870435 RepID=A0A0C3MVU1_PISTI|nr:hypothetical protein M404DRAFT_36446 [Pisolithus tinctorius Marx 270]